MYFRTYFGDRRAFVRILTGKLSAAQEI